MSNQHFYTELNNYKLLSFQHEYNELSAFKNSLPMFSILFT